MAQKKIYVDRILYRYRVDESFTMIQGFRPVRNEELGHFEEPSYEEYLSGVDRRFLVSPRDVEKFIRKNK